MKISALKFYSDSDEFVIESSLISETVSINSDNELIQINSTNDELTYGLIQFAKNNSELEIFAEFEIEYPELTELETSVMTFKVTNYVGCSSIFIRNLYDENIEVGDASFTLITFTKKQHSANLAGGVKQTNYPIRFETISKNNSIMSNMMPRQK